jgi:hypothetical protein
MEEKAFQIGDTQLGIIQRQVLLYREFGRRHLYPMFHHMPELKQVASHMRHEFLCLRLSQMMEGVSERRMDMRADAASFIHLAHRLFPNYGAIIDDRAGYHKRKPAP